MDWNKADNVNCFRLKIGWKNVFHTHLYGNFGVYVGLLFFTTIQHLLPTLYVYKET